MMRCASQMPPFNEILRQFSKGTREPNLFHEKRNKVCDPQLERIQYSVTNQYSLLELESICFFYFGGEYCSKVACVKK